MNSYTQELYLVSQDFLQLLAKKQKQAEVSKEVDKEFEVLNTFFEVVNNIIHRADVQQHTQRLEGVTQHVMCKILEAELRKAYNAMYTSGNIEMFTKLAATTVLPGKKELEEQTTLKSHDKSPSLRNA